MKWTYLWKSYLAKGITRNHEKIKIKKVLVAMGLSKAFVSNHLHSNHLKIGIISRSSRSRSRSSCSCIVILCNICRIEFLFRSIMIFISFFNGRKFFLPVDIETAISLLIADYFLWWGKFVFEFHSLLSTFLNLPIWDWAIFVLQQTNLQFLVDATDWTNGMNIIHPKLWTNVSIFFVSNSIFKLIVDSTSDNIEDITDSTSDCIWKITAAALKIPAVEVWILKDTMSLKPLWYYPIEYKRNFSQQTVDDFRLPLQQINTFLSHHKFSIFWVFRWYLSALTILIFMLKFLFHQFI